MMGRLGKPLTRLLRRPGGRLSPGSAVAALLVVLVLAGTVLGLARVRTDTTAAAFLPAGDPTLKSLAESAEAFGGDPIVVLAESRQPKELLSGEHLARLLSAEGKLAKLPDVAVVYGPATMVNQIASSTRNLMATIFGRRDAARAAAEGASRRAGSGDAAVKTAGDAAVAELDARYGPLIVAAMPAGLPTVRNPSFVDSVIFEPSGEVRPSWRYLVPAPNAVTILVRPRQDLDEAASTRLVASVRAVIEQAGLPTSRVTVTGTPTVFADLGALVRREIPLTGAVALGLILACYLSVSWTRRRRHRLVPLVSTVGATLLTLAVFGWAGITLSLGSVAFLPILIGVGSDFPSYVVRGAPRRKVLVAAGASAAGFGSLAISPLPFVRDLGLALGIGVLLAVAIAYLIDRFVIRRGPEPSEPQPSESARPVSGERTVPAVPGWRRALLAGELALVAGLGWVALPWLQVRAQPEELAAGLPSVVGAEHAERVMGSSGEIDVLLRGPNVRGTEALAWMRQARDVLIRQFGDSLRLAVSLPDLVAFLGPNPSPEQLRAGLDLLPHYLVASVVNDQGDRAVISLGISLRDLSDQRDLLTAVNAALPPPPNGMTAEVVGLPAAAVRGYELVSANRYLVNGLGILAAGLVLLIGLPRRTDAVRAVAAAVLATGWGLLGAWVLGVALSPLSVALGSLTTATACEFTVLLGGAAGARGVQLRRTVLVAALAATLGYLSLTISGLAVLRHFGLLLAATVLLSLLAATVTVRLFPPVTGGSDAPDPLPNRADRRIAV